MALRMPSIDSMGVDRNNYPDAASDIFHQIPVEEHIRRKSEVPSFRPT